MDTGMDVVPSAAAWGGGLDMSSLGSALPLPSPPTKESLEVETEESIERAIVEHTAILNAAWKSKDSKAVTDEESRIAELKKALEDVKEKTDVITYLIQGMPKTIAKYTTSAAAAGTQEYYAEDIEEVGQSIRRQNPSLSSAKINSGYIAHNKRTIGKLVKKQHTAFDSKLLFYSFPEKPSSHRPSPLPHIFRLQS